MGRLFTGTAYTLKSCLLASISKMKPFIFLTENQLSSQEKSIIPIVISAYLVCFFAHENFFWLQCRVIGLPFLTECC